MVDGALSALNADADLQLHLVGPREVADQVRSACADPSRVQVVPADSAVGMAESASRARRRGTSVHAGIAVVAAGEAEALVSAGLSGATVTAAVLGLGRITGVRRPALAVLLPARDGPVVLLDVGAGVEASATLLVQHAALGAGYARRALHLSRPRVGLLSVGTEPGKGDRVRRAADAALRASPLAYVGNVEGYHVPLGGLADVVVTDGFTGNVLLKGMEGAVALAGASVPPPAAPRAAVLLGVRGTVVVCHGAATGPDIASGIQLAAGLRRDSSHPSLAATR
ncbi:MAG: phosphate acyltransferase PlsX [Micromonosporaceae bacterium]|nr:phosphate acyltransferase PlsX [Micromonosporaceae bacterium]